MTIRITSLNFKNGAGYQPGRHKEDERLFDRHNLRLQKTAKNKSVKPKDDIDDHSGHKGINIKI